MDKYLLKMDFGIQGLTGPNSSNDFQITECLPNEIENITICNHPILMVEAA